MVRSFVGSLRAAHHAASGAPELVVTTPVRQLHELGALIAAASAAADDWQVTYLGPDLPAEEIAAAASYSAVLEETGARRVESYREMREELDLLRSF